MSEAGIFILAILQLAFCVFVIAACVSWLAGRLFPNSKFGRKAGGRVWYALLKSISIPFQCAKWILKKAFTTTPEFNRHHTVFEDGHFTPLELFDAVEQVFQTRNVNQASVLRITRREWHLLSTSRTYLLISFRQAAFVVSAVVLGTSLLVTERFTKNPSKIFLIILQVPVLGAAMERFFIPPTFYREDIYYAFEQSVRSSLREATDLLDAQEIGGPNIVEQQPVLQQFYE